MTAKAKSVCADKVKCGRGHLIKNQPAGRISARLEWTHKYFCMGAVGGDESRSNALFVCDVALGVRSGGGVNLN
jgi:hypothetical protein